MQTFAIFIFIICFTYTLQAQTDFYEQGMKSYRAKAYDKAAYYFDLALKKNPKEDKIFFMKGRCKVEMDQFHEALDNFTQASNLLPQESEYYYYKGLCEWKLKRIQTALDNLEKSLLYDPNNFLAYKIIGAIYYELNIPAKAKEYFDKALLAQGSDPSNMTKGKLDDYGDAYGVILRAYLREAKANPNSGLAHFNLGMLKTIAQDNYGALTDFSKALEIDPALLLTFYYRGLVRYNMNKFKEAVEDLFKYTQKYPEDTKAKFLLDKIKEKLNMNVVADHETNEIFLITEEMPEFPGGWDEMQKFIAQNIQYPKEAMRLGIKGRVMVSFVVNTKGELVDAQILKGIGGGCELEALRVLSIMPKWKPGKHNGKPVSVKYTLPIKFSISE